MKKKNEKSENCSVASGVSFPLQEKRVFPFLEPPCIRKSFSAIYICTYNFGNMAELADATDLKSVDFNNREGSSPSIPKWERVSLLSLDYRKGQQNK